MPDAWRQLGALLKEAGGLDQQGHVPTIERMLAAGRSWAEIGNAIGWKAATAEEHWRDLKAGRGIYAPAQEGGHA